MFQPWNTSLLNTNWGSVRYGIVILSIAIFMAVSSFLIASDTRIKGGEEQEQTRQLQASPVLLKRSGN